MATLKKVLGGNKLNHLESDVVNENMQLLGAWPISPLLTINNQIYKLIASATLILIL